MISVHSVPPSSLASFFNCSTYGNSPFYQQILNIYSGSMFHCIFLIFLLPLLLVTSFSPVYDSALKTHLQWLFDKGQHYRYSCHLDNKAECNDLAINYYTETRLLLYQAMNGQHSFNSVLNFETNEAYLTLVSFNYAGMLNDLALLLLQSSDGGGKVSELARNLYEEALHINPHELPVLSNYAGLQVSLGNHATATEIYEHASKVALEMVNNESLKPSTGTGSNSVYDHAAYILHNYGTHCFSQGDNEKAILLWEKVIYLSPAFVSAFHDLASVYCSTGSVEEMKRVYQSGLNAIEARSVDGRLSSSDSNEYATMMLLQAISIIPVIAPENRFINSIRDAFVDNIKGLLQILPSDCIQTPWEHLGCCSLGYYVIYHGYEDILMRQLLADVHALTSGSLLRYVSPFTLNNGRTFLPKHVYLTGSALSSAPAGPHLEPISGEVSYVAPIAPVMSDARRDRIKIGFLSSFFYHHSVGILLRGVIKNLDTNIYDVYILSAAQEVYDKVSMDLESYANSKSNVHMLIFPYQFAGNIKANRAYRFRDANSKVSFTNEIFHGMREDIASLELDVLVYGDIGMGDITYFLSFSRLASKSILFWGHAVTSGITVFSEDEGKEHIGGPDYFVSSVLFEKQYNEKCSSSFCHLDNPQLQYSERLLLQSGLTTYFERPIAPFSVGQLRYILLSRRYAGNDDLIDAAMARNEIMMNKSGHVLHVPSDNHGYAKWISRDAYEDTVNLQGEYALPHKLDYIRYLMSDRLGDVAQICSLLHTGDENHIHIYGLLQTLYKLHPDNDLLIAGILENDPDGIVVVPRGASNSFMDRIRERWIRLGYLGNSTNTLSNNLFDRVLFVRPMSENEFITLAAVVDVMLDPFPVGGGRSSFEIFSTGTPIVMLEPRTAILQLTRAMYVAMGLDTSVPIPIANRRGEMRGKDMANCIASSNAEYISAAIAIADDYAGIQSKLRRDISKTNYRLYFNDSVVKEWEKMLMFVHVNPRPIPMPRQRTGGFSNKLSEALQAKCIEKLGPIGKLGQSDANSSVYGNWRVVELPLIQFSYCMVPPIYLSEYSLEMYRYEGFNVVDSSGGLVKVQALDNVSVRSKESPSAVHTPLKEYLAKLFGGYAYLPALVSDNSVAKSLMFAIISQNSSPHNVIEYLSSSNHSSLQETQEAKRLKKHQYVYAMEFSDVDGYVENAPMVYGVIAIPQGMEEKYGDFCINSTSYLDSHIHFLKALYLCSAIARGVLRSYPDVAIHNTFQVHFDDPTLVQHLASVQSPEIHCTYYSPTSIIATSCGLDLTVHMGDDIAQLMWWVKYKYQIDDGGLGVVTQLVENSVTHHVLGSVDWNHNRFLKSRDFLCKLISRNRSNSVSLPAGLHDQSTKYSSLLPTCRNDYDWKNLHHKEPYPSGASGITLAITTSKRYHMFVQTITALESSCGGDLYSVFDDVLIVDDDSSDEDRGKMLENYGEYTLIFKRGHARSMNVIMNTVRTPYMVYLEDDWVYNADTNSSFMSEGLSKALCAAANAHTNAKLCVNGAVPLGVLIEGAQRILEKSTREERVVQVLFNEQAQRACAMGDSKLCRQQDMRFGGWERSVSISNDVILPYHLHEFGVMGTFTQRLQDFSFWPGVSLNPGIWDVHHMKHIFQKFLFEDVANGSSSHSQSNDAWEYFNETAVLFEQQFSTFCWFAGLKMAYLESIPFRHIGDISAYSLDEENRRPWD